MGYETMARGRENEREGGGKRETGSRKTLEIVVKTINDDDDDADDDNDGDDLYVYNKKEDTQQR